MITNEYLTSAKIIEFFWFFSLFLLFVFALVIRFCLKIDIHPTQFSSASEGKYTDNSKEHKMDP